MDPVLLTIWQFVRGDLPVALFEQWLYHSPGVEERLGTEQFLALVSADFRDADVVVQMKASLQHFARMQSELPCECVTLSDITVVGMEDSGVMMRHLVEVARRGEPYWWLSMSRCSVCQSAWLVAQEERQNDIFLLHRLTDAESRGVLGANRWPAHFDLYKTLLQLGRLAGRSFQFVDPIGDSSLAWTMADMARAEPGIGLVEIAQLLNLDHETAEIVAEQAMRQHHVQITFDHRRW